MSILVNKDSRIVVQGITGSEGTFHSNRMIILTFHDYVLSIKTKLDQRPGREGLNVSKSTD